MRARLMLVVILAGLAGCAGPYDTALDSRELQRPEPAPTEADQQALAPYLDSPYFRDQR